MVTFLKVLPHITWLLVPALAIWVLWACYGLGKLLLPGVVTLNYLDILCILLLCRSIRIGVYK